MFDKEDLRLEDGEWRFLGLKIENKQSRFEDFIRPHQHLMHMFFFVLCRESRYFEDIVKF